MKEKVKEIIVKVKNDELFTKELINDDTHLINEVSLDSLQLINFMLRVEDEFKIQIDFDNLDMDNFNSLESFCQYISSLKV